MQSYSSCISFLSVARPVLLPSPFHDEAPRIGNLRQGRNRRAFGPVLSTPPSPCLPLTLLLVSIRQERFGKAVPRSSEILETWLLQRRRDDRRLYRGKLSSFLISLSEKSIASN